MKEKHLNQTEEDQPETPIGQQSSVLTSAESSRMVSIIDETNRTRDKVSKRRKKKGSRLRKPLQNDELLKNYFELDQPTSKELTTFKIVQPSASSSRNEEKVSRKSTSTPPESFIAKEMIKINSKSSDSEESRAFSISTPLHSTYSMDDSNNYQFLNQFTNSTTQTLHHVEQQTNTIINQEPNQVSNMENFDSFLNTNEILNNENDNFQNLLNGIGVDQPGANNQDNMDLLQLLMHLTNPNIENSSLERNREE